MQISQSCLPPVSPDVPKRIGLKNIWKQVQLDLIGKDVQDATTYSYVWIADQMGHIGLGWASSVLCYWMSLIVYPLLPSFLQFPSPFPDIFHHTFREAPYFWAIVVGTLAPLGIPRPLALNLRKFLQPNHAACIAKTSMFALDSVESNFSETYAECKFLSFACVAQSWLKMQEA